MHRPGFPTKARVAAGFAALAAVTLALPACNDDGRELRPADPDQTASVSTIAPVTEPPPIPDEALGGFDFPATTVPVLTAPVLTAPPLTVSTTVAPTSSAGKQSPAVAVLHAPWSSGAAVDERYTCDGDNVSPALSWTPAPEGTMEIAITLTDDDAPDFVHWAVAGIAPGTTAVKEAELPAGAVAAINSAGTVGYTGPCPSPGEEHTYNYTVFFLGVPLGVDDGAPAEELLAAIRSSALDSASVTSSYSRG